MWIALNAEVGGSSFAEEEDCGRGHVQSFFPSKFWLYEHRGLLDPC